MKPEIFVFGSNTAGRHGKGAAKVAREKHGAVYGEGNGHHGDSYAIPTKDGKLTTLPLRAIQSYVDMFIGYAGARPDLNFMVTAIGCGLAGYEAKEIAPMFEPCLALENVYLPADFCCSLATTTRVSFDRDGVKVAR